MLDLLPEKEILSDLTLRPGSAFISMAYLVYHRCKGSDYNYPYETK